MEFDVVAFSSHTLFGRLIKLVSRSQITHVGWVLRFDGQDGLWVAEALEGKGVRLVPFSVWEQWVATGQGTISRLKLNVGEDRFSRWSANDFAISQVGREYASPRQFVRSFSWLWHKIVCLTGVPRDTDAGRWFCSEFVAAILIAGGLQLDKLPAETFPRDIACLPCLTVVKTEYP